MKHPTFAIAGILLALLMGALAWTQTGFAGSELPAGAELAGVLSPFYDKPVHNWRVCADLGVGVVPGLGIRRQRFRLCHSQGWRAGVLLAAIPPGAKDRLALLSQRGGDILVRQRHPKLARVPPGGNSPANAHPTGPHPTGPHRNTIAANRNAHPWTAAANPSRRA
jgi:hypothetical protein